jgi:hypothetical protein
MLRSVLDYGELNATILRIISLQVGNAITEREKTTKSKCLAEIENGCSRQRLIVLAGR